MAESFAALTFNAQWFEATLDLAGLVANTQYEVVRRTVGDVYPPETVEQFTAGADRRIFTDITPQVGVATFYTLHPAGQSTVLATSQTITIPYSPALQADKPLWDTAQGTWPILRAVTPPYIDPLRLPVADYDAEWGYRASVYQVVGSEYPVVSSDVVVMKQGDLVFLTSNNTERHKFIDYVRHHRTVHLASPCVDGLQHMFFRVLGVSESVPVKARPLLRQWQVRFQQVPKPGWYGSTDWAGTRTWGDVAAGASSWADARTVFGATWLDWRGTPSNIGPMRMIAVEEGSW